MAATTTDELPDLGEGSVPSDEVTGTPSESPDLGWGDPSSDELVGVESELTNLRVDDLPPDQAAGMPTEIPELGTDDLQPGETPEASGAQHDPELHIALGPVMPGSADPTSIWPAVRGLN
jgi:hypothetical protein